MKRRGFLKGLTASLALPFVPAIGDKEPPRLVEAGAGARDEMQAIPWRYKDPSESAKYIRERVKARYDNHKLQHRVDDLEEYVKALEKNEQQRVADTKRYYLEEVRRIRYGGNPDQRQYWADNLKKWRKSG